MTRLAAMLGYGVMLVTASAAAAATYVPGQVRDGVYVRPHFIAISETLDDRAFPVPGAAGRAEAEADADPGVLQPPSLLPTTEDASS